MVLQIILSPTEAAYIAGIIDGEGSISLIRNCKGKNRRPEMSVTNTSLELLQYLHSKCGGRIRTRSPPKQNQNQPYEWKCTGGRLFCVLSQIAPFLKERNKVKRAALLLNEYHGVTPRNGKYTPEVLINKAMFESKFMALSSRGTRAC